MDQGKHSELTFQAIVESTPNSIILVNKDGRIAYVNNEAILLFGHKRSDMIGQKIEMLIPKRFQQNHTRYRDMFLGSPESRAMGSGRDLYAVTKSGLEIPVEVGLNPLVTIDGTMVLVSIIDITERKRAQEHIRLVVESAPNGMILTNSEGKILMVNTQTEHLFGYKRNELVGEALELLMPTRYRKLHPMLMETYLQNPVVRSMGAGRELFARRKDGSEFPVEIGLNPIETDHGIEILASVIDISERKRHEIVRKDQLVLELRNKELEQFNYIASHDLQEPLRTVTNYITIIEEDHGDELSPEVREYLHTINRATKRMSTLVRLLLDYSQIGRNRRLALVDCNEVVKNVVDDLDNMIKSTKAEILYHDLPRLEGYEIELRQLFQNLISNSIKFQREGVSPKVDIGCKKQDSVFEFYVSDNGIGIEPQHFDRIFHLFQQLNRNNEGHGIGLANCKKIVELHGGQIWLESEYGQGTTFKFTISNLSK